MHAHYTTRKLPRRCCAWKFFQQRVKKRSHFRDILRVSRDQFLPVVSYRNHCCTTKLFQGAGLFRRLIVHKIRFKGAPLPLIATLQYKRVAVFFFVKGKRCHASPNRFDLFDFFIRERVHTGDNWFCIVVQVAPLSAAECTPRGAQKSNGPQTTCEPLPDRRKSESDFSSRENLRRVQRVVHVVSFVLDPLQRVEIAFHLGPIGALCVVDLF